MRRMLSRVSVVLLMVAGTISASVAVPTAAHAATERLEGEDRYATSVAISQAVGDYAGTVFLASGAKFPDALAAGPVAAAEGAALLLTTPTFVPDVVLGEIHRIAPTEIVLVGSADSIGESVRTQLQSALPDVRIERIGGDDRVATALLLLDRLAAGSGYGNVWVVSGHTFPDALVAASVAGRSGGAIVLDHHSGSASAAAAWFSRIRPYVAGRAVQIAGSEASVSAYDEALLRDAGASAVQRYAGADRYGTAIAIHDVFSPSAPGATMLLATGQNFPDALAGAALAARSGAPLYLSPSPCHDGIAALLRQERDQRGITTVIGLGSAASLSDVALRLEPCPPAPTATPTPTPTPAPTPPPPGPSPSGDANCSDFATRADAQSWWDYWRSRGYTNPGGLDGDGDWLVCESKRP